MADQQQDSSSSSSSSGGVNVQSLKSKLANKFQANRALVLKLHSILTWEQDIYPIFLVALVSLAFLVIHLMNSSVLSSLSYIGILCALLDLGLPTLTKNLTSSSSVGSPTKATNDKDNQRLDKICLDLAKTYAFVRSLCDQCTALKTKSPKLYYPALLGALFVSAYLGNKFNNLFLTYLATLLVVLYPGLDKKGIPQRAVEFVFLKLGQRPPAFATSSSSGAGGERRSSGKRN